MQVLVVANASPFSVKVRFPLVEPQDSLAIPVGLDQSRGSCKVTHNAREAGSGTGGSGGLFCALLAWVRAV